ncbi:MAG: glycosyltransferase family 4 protein [Anaerolineae bacterium]|nr:glycosyltransferase family 4 protein [Anaerolineae bacterium]
MRILIVVHGFPPSHSAGAERQAERTALWLARNGHEVEVFTAESVSQPGFEMRTDEQDGLIVHRISYDVKESNDPFRKLYDNPQVGDALRQLLNERHFDLVHLVSGYLFGGQVIHTVQNAGIPLVITLTEYWFMCTRLNLIQATGGLCSGPENDEKCMRCLMEDKRRYRLPAQSAPVLMDAFWSVAQYLPFATEMTHAVSERRNVLHHALDAADLVVSPSRYLINKFAEFGYDTSRYLFIRQGLTTPLGSKPEHAPRRSDDDNRLRLGYIGQIKYHKGIDLILDAVIRLTESGYTVSLDLWGSETEDPEYVASMKERSAPYANIHWNGRYVGAKVWDVLAGLDALLVPSRWYENSPTVILEAYEMGLPVIATNLGGMAELVEHDRSGLVFTLNSVDDLQHQLLRLLTEPDLLDRLRSGIPHVKTIEEEMHELMNAYHQLLAKSVH